MFAPVAGAVFRIDVAIIIVHGAVFFVIGRGDVAVADAVDGAVGVVAPDVIPVVFPFKEVAVAPVFMEAESFSD